MRKARRIVDPPAYHHVILELGGHVRAMSRREMESAAGAIEGFARFHGIVPVTWQFSPRRIELLILDQPLVPIAPDELLGLVRGAYAPATVSHIEMLLTLEHQEPTRSSRRRLSVWLQKRRGIEGFIRSFKGILSSRLGSARPPGSIWHDRYWSHPVADSPEILAGVIAFIHLMMNDRGAAQRYPSSWSAAIDGGREVQQRYHTALRATTWQAARQLVLDSGTRAHPIKPAAKRMGPMPRLRPDYGDFPIAPPDLVRKRAQHHNTLRATGAQRFHDMLSRWRQYVQKTPESLNAVNGIRIPAIATWASRTRVKLQRGFLSDAMVSALRSAGFIETPVEGLDLPAGSREAVWWRQFKRLQDFRAKNGSAAIPPTQPLREWVGYERSIWRAGRMPQQHADLLASIGVISPKPGSRAAKKRPVGKRAN